MRYVALPGTDLRPSVICFGTGDLGGSVDRVRSFALLDAFLGAGGSFLDTAKIYADWLPGPPSSSERTLGAWMRARGSRARVVLATKGAHPDLAAMHVPRLSPAEIVSDLEASLRNLQTDCIDLYWLHRDDPRRPVGEIVEALVGQVRAGRIRAYGFSNWSTARLREAFEYASHCELPVVAGNQPLWNLAAINVDAMADKTLAVMDAAMRQFHTETGIAAVPYSSQAGGLFQKLASGSLQATGPGTPAMYATAENALRVERARTVAQRAGLTLSQVVLGYLLSQPFPVCPIVGCKSEAHLADSLSAADVRLSAEDLIYLEGGAV